MGFYDKNTQNAPSTSVVVPFFMLSAISWVVVTIFLFFLSQNFLKEGFFNVGLLAVTHLFVLGFVSSIMSGALFQLLPVIFIQKIHSEKLAKLTFGFLISGMIGLVLSFGANINGIGLTVSAVLVNIAVILFMLNIWKTIGKSSENNTAKLYIRTSAVWLILTTLAGLLMAINFWFPYFNFSHIEFLKVHAHLGVIGWFMSLIIGVSCVLVPMFLLVHHLNYRPLKIGYFLINGGLVVGILAKIISNDYLLYVGYLSVAAGFVLYLKFIYGIYKARPRKQLDFGLQKTMVSYLFLVLGMVIAALFVAGFKIEETVFYLAIILVGFVATIILGQFYKTLPFIIWLKVYKPYIGKTKTLLPKQLYDHQILKYQYYSHVSGLVLFTIGILFHLTVVYFVGTAFLFVGAILFLTNVSKVVFHKRQVFQQAVVLTESVSTITENTYHVAPKEREDGIIETVIIKPEGQEEETAPEIPQKQAVTYIPTDNLEDDIYYRLMEVIDPELFVNIIDLGLVYDLDINTEIPSVKITMTLTSKGCPLSDAIKSDINGTLGKYFPDLKVDINIIWEPAWDMEKVSEEGRRQLMSKRG